MTFHQIFRRLLAAALTAFMAHVAHAQPVKIIIPASAGSGLDIQTRAAAPALSRALNNRPLVIENITGAGGLTGTSALVKAAPDGNTLAMVSNNHAVNPSVYRKMPYDSLADITPIAVIGETPFLLVVNPSRVPARTAKELQALLKAKPGGYNYASSGNGTIIHLGGAMVVEAFGVDVKHIPYKGMAPMVNDIISGQVEMGVVAINVAQQHIATGALRAIGVMGKQRIPSLPTLPTMAEQGFPDVDLGGWFALIGPAKLPAAEVKRLHAAVLTAFADPETKAAMDKQQVVVLPMTPEASAQFFKSEQERYGRLAKKAEITLD